MHFIKTLKFPLILVNFGFCDQTFRPNFHCALHQKLKISTMLVEWVEKKKKCWANDAVNSYNTSKCEIFYSFFTNFQCHFCKIKSGRIFARFFFNFQRWLGCEIQQVGTKPRKYSCRIDLRYCYDSNRLKIMAQNLANFVTWKNSEFSEGLKKVCICNF